MSAKSKKTYQDLDDLLDSTGLKKKIIAERLGVDYSTFYSWRVKPSMISAVELGELSEVTGIDFNVLFKVVKNFKKQLDIKAS